MRPFDLRLLESFVVLADEGLHVTGAAERLGVGQPRLSQQMARLQRQLGTSLIVRGERRTVLTAAGAAFLPHARAAVERANALSADLHTVADTLRIHMGVGAHHGARQLVTAFMTARPSTRVEIAEGMSSDARRALLRGAVDAAFELRTACPAKMRFEPVDRSPLGVLTGPGHPIAQRGRVAWGDLTGEHILFGHAEGGSWNALVRSCLAAARVVVTEEIAPPMPRLHYLVPILAGGTVSMITGRALFEPLPPGLTWTALTPHRDLEFGVMWDPHRSTAPLQSFVAHVRRYAAGVPAAPPPAGARPTPVTAAPAPDTGDVVRRLGFDLRLLLPFVIVAEERHFGRAAERLMTAQPSLSRQVARLESQLGAQLLIRSTRAVRLTEAGRMTVAAACDILDHARRAGISAGPDPAVTATPSRTSSGRTA